ncbi:cyclic nucleotide-binding domain-containing protein [Hymenobacter caeli]|uniref:CRP-like cAMP-binding protein n=1 Tax=Hymenobacter caeli TaxID=2735894 RepID=A0ABX2FRP2_9BACT|nr:cyclic nucleotide-binding domain-containing protein [Hymenobacter caeli]NRT19612.1 CRP-like cAMP-binding protein [Hymenobacter caeli]
MKTILLLADDPADRERLAALLELAGYGVHTAPTGPAGLALALAHLPDLVLCAVGLPGLPGLDGYAVLAHFTQHPRLAGVPFLLLASGPDHAGQRRAMALGADDYLAPPLADDELLGAIAGRLDRFRHLQAGHDLAAPGGLGEFVEDARATARLDHLAGHRKAHAVRRRQDVYLEGDEATRAYFVQAGRLKTLKTDTEGKELITGLYGPGEFLGYLPLLEHTPHRDSAVAIDDSELIYISAEDFTQLLHHAEVGPQFMRLLAGRVSEREQQLLDMAYHSVRRRVADALLRLHAQAGGTAATAIELAREDMAALVGTAPESLIRAIREFKQAGLLELTARTIRLLEPDKLRHTPW